MKSILASSLIFALSAPYVFAEDAPKPWASVTFNVLNVDTAVSVTLEGTEKLTKVNLSVIGSSLNVPIEELEGIGKPALDTAQLLFGEDWYGEWKEGEEPTPHFIIEMNYGEKSKYGSYSTVRFLFHSGKFQQRVTSIQKTETVWEEFTKLPGEEPVATGTATRAPHRPQVPSQGPEKLER